MKKLLPTAMALVVVSTAAFAQLATREPSNSALDRVELTQITEVETLQIGQDRQLSPFARTLPAERNMIVGAFDHVAFASDEAPPSLYVPPVGAMHFGLSYDWMGLNNTFVVAPPFSTWTFSNLTEIVSPQQTTLWTYTNINGVASTSTERNLVMTVEGHAEFEMPKLTTTLGETSTEYTHGTVRANAFILSGGTSRGGQSTFGFTKANLDYGIVAWQFGANNFVFGTGTSLEGQGITGLISYFEGNPNGMLFFTGVNIAFGTLTGPDDTPLRLEIVRAVKGTSPLLALGERIATATTTIGAAHRNAGANSGTIVFDGFFIEDAHGFQVPVDYLEIEGDFAIILTGHMVPGVALSVISERYERRDTRRFSFWLHPESGAVFFPNINETMYFMLENAAYSFLQSEIDRIEAPAAGGTYRVRLEPLFNNVRVANTLPSWIGVTFENNFEQGDWHSTAVITVQPSTVAEKREFDIEFATFGARHTVTVQQVEGNVSVGTVTASRVSVVNTPSSFELTYTADFTSVEVFSISGQRVALHNLPPTGSFSLPTYGLARGAYIVRFIGNSVETVKVIR